MSFLTCEIEVYRRMSKEDNSKQMHFVGHLTELRNRLIGTMVFFIVTFIISFVFSKQIYRFFEKDINIKLTVTGITDVLWIYIVIAALLAIICTLPFLSLQIWLFIRPGLTKKERRVSLSYIPVIVLLFVLGLIFGYILFIQLILPFLLSWNEGNFNEMFTVDRYFRTLMHFTIPFGIVFEIPIILMFLTSIGMITPDFLKRNRKYAYFILLIVGGVVTPPDVLLQVAVAVPLFLLYELSIYLTVLVQRKKMKDKVIDSEK